MSVKSTYNFVPAPSEEEVYKPGWANQVSHDIPFSDGESGEIELKITAETPIFIRNGHSKEKEENEFSHYFDKNGKKIYFIPGSSLKGMFRNVMEIMSFSRMTQVDSSPIYGLRDMNNPNYASKELRNTKTGWLTKENSKWSISECHSDRVRLQSLKSYFKNLQFDIDNATAKEKYETFQIKDFSKVYNFDTLSEIDKTGNVYSITENDSQIKGHLVMYGSMNGKKYDYIFHSGQKKHELIDQDLLQRTLDIEKDTEDSLWHYFINELKLTKIPVFFKVEKEKVIHFGFSKLYRQNNALYLRELEPLKSYFDDKEKEPDLTSLIFGKTSKNDSLKGRVMISHATIDTFNEVNKQEERILSTPNPSYYPFYLNQNNPQNNGYATYINEDAKLSGYKRYPLHITLKDSVLQKDSMLSNFKPLDKGNVFTFKIRFHNLKKVEIGALISAITFHNTTNSFHSLGGGKPYGFGKVKMEIIDKKEMWNEYLYYFEKAMEDHFANKIKNTKWIDSLAIKEITALSQSSNISVDRTLVYPQLELANVSAKIANEFNNIKKNKEYLKPFSEINGNVNIMSTIKSFEDKKNKENELKIQQAIPLKEEAYSFIAINDLDKAHQKYVEAMQLFDDGSLPNFKLKIDIKKREQEEQLAFKLAKESSIKDLCESFLANYPNSNQKAEIEEKLRLLNAVSSIPENVSNKDNFKQFANNTDNWVKKLVKDGQSISSLGFEKEHIEIICKIAKLENYAKEWLNGTNEKRISQWYGAEKLKEIIRQINS